MIEKKHLILYNFLYHKVVLQVKYKNELRRTVNCTCILFLYLVFCVGSKF